MKGNEQKKDKFFRILTIVLIIIICILLFFTNFGKINNYLLPTGNVDVFNIDINCKSKDHENEKEVTVSDKNGRETANLSAYDENRDKNIVGKVFVDDKNGNYLYQQRLEIFNNAAYEYTNKIAPGVSNTYHFVIHNSSDMNLKYYVEMYEDSEYKVNLKYRLKRNNNYVIGNESTWVTADELKTAFKNILTSDSDKYSLDWKWFDNDNKADTLAGVNMRSLYKLNIRVHFDALEA